MAFKRKDVRDILTNESLSEDEKLSKLMDLHHEDADAIKDDVDKLTEQLATANHDLEEAKAAKDKAESDLTNLRNDNASRESRNKKETAYTKILRDLGMTDKRIEAVLRVTKLDDIEVNDDGTCKDSDKLIDNIKSEWAEFIPVSSSRGAGVSTPPGNGGKTMTKDEIMKIADTAERQKAIAENHELFGF